MFHSNHKTMKTVNFEDFKINSVSNPGALERFLPEAQQLLTDVSKFMPARIVINISTWENISHFESCQVDIIHPDIRISVSYSSFNKRYIISCPSLHALQHTEVSAYSSRNTGLEAPNKIGVLSKSKLMAWIKYYEAVYSYAKQIDLQRASEKESFLRSLEGHQVDWNRDQQRGQIHCNGLVFSFEILKSYISTRIEIDRGIRHDMGTFVAMTGNSSLMSNRITTG